MGHGLQVVPSAPQACWPPFFQSTSCSFRMPPLATWQHQLNSSERLEGPCSRTPENEKSCCHGLQPGIDAMVGVEPSHGNFMILHVSLFSMSTKRDDLFLEKGAGRAIPFCSSEPQSLLVEECQGGIQEMCRGLSQEP